ncbi:MAG TPA: PAS domain S-box protein, partial [Thermoanaerobaculia bacterium]|nr:PAS domain S-box protein [Thermoanaerobaculia bacterium]
MPKNPGRKAPAPTPERRHWLRLALSSIADAVLIADRDGRVVFLNPAAESLTGWPAKDARGAPLDAVFRVVSEETRQPVESPGARALRLGSAMGAADSALLIARDGTDRPIELSSAPFSDAGGIAGVALVFRDVTERRRSEQALRQSEERFRLLVESVKDYAIFMLTPQGHVASWNAGAERIKGYRADEIIGKHFSCFYPEEAVASGWPQTELELAVADGRFEDEGWRIRQDGSRFWANVVITAVVDREGRLKGFAKVTRDLTERRRAEAELRATQVEAAALDEINRRKDEFLAMLGHELRNPLAPILNAVHLLALQPGSADPTQERARSMIERQVGQMSRLVDDLLEVSRIGRGLIRLEQEDVDLREVVGRALDSTRPLLEQRRHELINNWPLEPIWVHGDPTRLEQVVVNLLNNAAKYTEEGGRIAVGVAQEGGRAVVRVKDNGVGIPPELLPRIFDLFTQAE